MNTQTKRTLAEARDFLAEAVSSFGSVLVLVALITAAAWLWAMAALLVSWPCWVVTRWLFVTLYLQ